MSKPRIGGPDSDAGIQLLRESLLVVAILHGMDSNLIQRDDPGRIEVGHFAQLVCLVCVKVLLRPFDIDEWHVNTSEEELISRYRLGGTSIGNIESRSLVFCVAFIYGDFPLGRYTVNRLRLVVLRIGSDYEFVVLRNRHSSRRKHYLSLIPDPVSKNRSPNPCRIVGRALFYSLGGLPDILYPNIKCRFPGVGVNRRSREDNVLNTKRTCSACRRAVDTKAHVELKTIRTSRQACNRKVTSLGIIGSRHNGVGSAGNQHGLHIRPRRVKIDRVWVYRVFGHWTVGNVTHVPFFDCKGIGLQGI